MTWLRSIGHMLAVLLQAGAVASSVLAHTIANDGDGPSAVLAGPVSAAAAPGIILPPPADTVEAGGSLISADRFDHEDWAPQTAPGQLIGPQAVPLASTWRPLLRSKAARSSGPAPAATHAGPAGARAIPQTDDEISAALDELQESVAEVLAEATGAHLGPEGRLSFSLAGLEGFHYRARDGGVSFGHGDLSLAIVDHGAERPGRQPSGERAAQTPPAAQDTTATREIFQFIKEIFEYPLVWLLILLLLIGKFVLLVSHRRARKGRHRRRSGANEPVKLKRIRRRIRFRIKRQPTTVGLQQPR